MLKFTATNAKTLYKQIDAANAARVAAGKNELIFNFGKNKIGWYVHNEFGIDLRDGLTFADLRSRIERDFETAEDMDDLNYRRIHYA